MAIREQEMVVVAEVEVTDEYRVELWQHRKRRDYSPAQARELAEDLLRMAARAEVLLEEHIEEGRRREWQPVLHGGEAVV